MNKHLSLSIGLLTFALSFPCADAQDKLIGLDAITGKERQILKDDNVYVSTKQSVHKNDLIQRNNVVLLVMPKDRKLSKGQCTALEQCVGKIAKVNLSCAQSILVSDVENASQSQTSSHAVKAKEDIAAGAFVEPSKVMIESLPVPPNETPKEWFSGLDDVVGRKTISAISAGSVVTEHSFGPRGTVLNPEPIMQYGPTGNPLYPEPKKDYQ